MLQPGKCILNRYPRSLFCFQRPQNAAVCDPPQGLHPLLHGKPLSAKGSRTQEALGLNQSNQLSPHAALGLGPVLPPVWKVREVPGAAEGSRSSTATSLQGLSEHFAIVPGRVVPFLF